jgi:hypothetical protein
MDPQLRRILSADDGGEGGGAGGGEGGGGESSWREGLSEEIREHPALTTIPDVSTLAQNFLATKEMVGKKGIILPKEGDAADIARFRTEIGVPETADGYELGDFAPPEGMPWSDEFQGAMLSKLHEIGIPNGQIRQIMDGYSEVGGAHYTAQVKTAEQGYEQGVAQLKEELGASYGASTKLAERAFKAAAGEHHEELENIVLPSGIRLGDHPAFVRTFINIGKQYEEAGLHGEKAGGSGSAKSPDQAKAEIATLKANPAYTDEHHPEHKLVVDRMNELYEQAYPDSAPEVL